MNIMLCVIGILSLLTALSIHRILKRHNAISKGPTYSKSVNRALLESGPYVTHGMVIDKEGNIHATSRRSQLWYSQLL
jgi:hypothetical protein